MDYTLVVGADAKHLRQLAWVWPTWTKHKQLDRVPMVLFLDRRDFPIRQGREAVRGCIDHPNLTVVQWPPEDVEYYRCNVCLDNGWPCEECPEETKWNNPQRVKMLSGFVHVPAQHVRTSYWLKLDTDTVAVPCECPPNQWIPEKLFQNTPAFVAQKWHYTKPPDQMQKLDAWTEEPRPDPPQLKEFTRPPLNLLPETGANKLKHPRIISWCGLFNTEFTQLCSHLATRTCGEGKLPVGSQDGYMWYVAQRTGHDWHQYDFRHVGWEHWSTEKNILAAVERSMG